MDTRAEHEGEGNRYTRKEILAAGAGAAAAASLLRNADAFAATPPRRGGRLRAAVAGRGGAVNEHLDPHLNPRPTVSLARTHAIYEGLFDYTPAGTIKNVLAQEVSANADGTVWRIRIKSGIEFHNGKTLTAEDVVWSLQRVRDPRLSTESKNDIYFLPPEGIRALDRTTIELRLNQPIGDIRDKMVSRGLGIAPADSPDLRAKPVGTGAFKASEFVPGDRSLFVRNPNYRVSGRPYLNELEIYTMDDTTAKMNALLAGQMDAIAAIDYTQIAYLKRLGYKILSAKTGGFIANFMNVTKAPFNDGRVRLAMRLLHNRQQMVDTIFGRENAQIGNDLPMKTDPLFAGDIPQIHYDPERAKFLLKQAGHGTRPTFELQCSSRFPGMIESATLLKENAKKAGVTVNLKVVSPTSYYSPAYLAHPFTQTLWFQRSLDLFILQALDSNAIFPETGWKRPNFDKFTRTARAELNFAKRKALWRKAQMTLWTQGGYAMWAYPNFVDATAKNVAGFVPSSVTWLGWFTFDGVHFT